MNDAIPIYPEEDPSMPTLSPIMPRETAVSINFKYTTLLSRCQVLSPPVSVPPSAVSASWLDLYEQGILDREPAQQDLPRSPGHDPDEHLKDQKPNSSPPISHILTSSSDTVTA